MVRNNMTLFNSQASGVDVQSYCSGKSPWGCQQRTVSVCSFFSLHIRSNFSILETDTFSACWVLFCVSIIHQTLTWTIWSLTYIIYVIFCMCMDTGDLSLPVLHRVGIRFDSRKILGWAQSIGHMMITYPCGDHAWSCFGLSRCCSCSVPPTLLMQHSTVKA